MPTLLLPAATIPGTGCGCPGKGSAPNPQAKRGHCPGAESKATRQALCPLCPEPLCKHSPAFSLSAAGGAGGPLSPHCLSGMDSGRLPGGCPGPPADTAHSPPAQPRFAARLYRAGESQHRHHHLRLCALRPSKYQAVSPRTPMHRCCLRPSRESPIDSGRVWGSSLQEMCHPTRVQQAPRPLSRQGKGLGSSPTQWAYHTQREGVAAGGVLRSPETLQL